MDILNEYLQVEGIEDLRQFFKTTGRIKKIKKNELFFKQGLPCKLAGYIHEGAFRYVSYNSTGKEQIVGYSFENDFVVDYTAFMNNSLSVADAQAIKDSNILIVNQNELVDFFSNYIHTDFRSRVAERFLSDIYNRLISFYCDTPEDRYIKLIQDYPQILNQVSLKEIASFIKIAPETLSRIRRKISRTKNT